MSGGQLILAATPLGNILDASPRLKQTLEQADLIAAEDTRRAKRLFADLNLEITAPVISLFEENEIEKIPDIIEKLKNGAKVVVISDAGTPAISDPGYRLVSKAIAENIAITVIPGPSAVISALVLSGLPTDRFAFEGFIARKGKERTEILNNLNTQSRTMVLFESPRRTSQTLEDIQEIVGPDRKAAVVREISKTYEEVIRGSIKELVTWANSKEVLGEITLVVAGIENVGKKEVDEEAVNNVKRLVDAGSSFKDAVQEVSTQRGLSRRELYEASLRLDS
ncbi:MAG: 16S rRNA (cytidine(1402)-2'-O)-methyltransferase [Candidatus Nanopelagicales bacterium]|jgi:16S rRNA (cytidine1402-2'-O)-methyltransferase|nr:16S rRNA (cytidine(1402)-2'-O)-methyltransferase [Candidatus Nanopelagicales bacterium]MBJ7393621.1 16S rRNA (cytidine(1402)-2'-O)-methyltransferase [Candidatus Nanopelagicales bacterium]